MRSSDTHRRGRPLVFLCMVVVGWTGLRVAMGAIDLEQPQPLTAITLAQEESSVVPSAAIDGLASGSDIAASEDTTVELDQDNASDLQAATMEDLPAPAQLDAPPPAHLVAEPIPLPAASTHNSLWMSASQFEPLPSGPATSETDPQDDQP